MPNSREQGKVNQAGFVTDLDGTLLHSDGSLSDRSAQFMTEALEQGVIVSYATARSWTSSSRVVSRIPWKYPVMLYNGAILFDPVTRKVAEGFFLELEITRQIIEYGKGLGIVPFWFGLDAADAEVVYYEQPVRPCDIAFRASREDDPRFRMPTNLSEPVDIRTVELAYIGTEDELAPLRSWAASEFGSRLHIHFAPDNYLKGYYFLEFGHPKANKRDALNSWMQLLGIDPTCMTVFGDNLNDIGLFEAAREGTRVAVGNAHPELLAAADLTIAANDEDSVAEYIYKKSFRRE